MNQHFNKKNIEAAIRVALVNPDVELYINGNRSKDRLKIKYCKRFGNFKVNFNDAYYFASFRDKDFISHQLSKDEPIDYVVYVICQVTNWLKNADKKAA